MNEPWWTLKGESLVRAVVELCRQLRTDSSDRLARYRRNACLYELARKQVGAGLLPTAELERLLSSDTSRCWPLGLSIVDATTAKICGTKQHKIQLVTTEATWRMKRNARKIDRTIEASWQQRQNSYQDIWDLGSICGRDALLFGTGFVKTIEDEDLGAVLHERVPPWQVLVEAGDAEHGNPRCIHHQYPAERYALASLLPKHKDAILSAPIMDSRDDATLWGIDDRYRVDRLLVCESWKTADGPDAPGIHTIVADGVPTPLVREPWEYRESQLEAIHYRRPVEGFFGTGIMDDVADLDGELNEMVSRMIQAVKNTGINRTYTKTGSVTDRNSLEALRSNEDSVLIYFDGDMPPRTESAAPFHPQMQEFAQLLRQSGFEFSGASSMMVTAQKQPGIEANSAILTMSDVQSERLSLFERQYQQLFPRVASQDIRAFRRLAKAKADFALKWKGGGYLREIKWEDIDIDDSQFWMEIQSAPSQKGTAAWRMQVAENLFQMGKLSADQYMEIQRSKDLEGQLNQQGGQSALLERMIDDILDSTPEQRQEGYLDDEHEQPLLIAPDPFMNLPEAIVQVYAAYAEAQLNRAPSEIQELFLRWLAMAQQASANKAPPPPTTGGPGMQPPQPGMQP